MISLIRRLIAYLTRPHPCAMLLVEANDSTPGRRLFLLTGCECQEMIGDIALLAVSPIDRPTVVHSWQVGPDRWIVEVWELRCAVERFEPSLN